MKRKKRHRVFFIHNDHYTRKQLLSKSCEYPVTFSNIFFVMLSAWNNPRDSVQKKKEEKLSSPTVIIVWTVIICILVHTHTPLYVYI